MIRKKIIYDSDSNIYQTSDGYYHHDYKDALERLRKKYETEKEPTAKEKAQKILDKLNENKEVRAEFDKLVRMEKLKKLDEIVK